LKNDALRAFKNKGAPANRRVKPLTFGLRINPTMVIHKGNASKGNRAALLADLLVLVFEYIAG
jgi:hypothetical protein